LEVLNFLLEAIDPDLLAMLNFLVPFPLYDVRQRKLTLPEKYVLFGLLSARSAIVRFDLSPKMHC
jgi:hypothetical protein